MTIKDSQRCAQYDVELLFIIQALFLEHTEQACILEFMINRPEKIF